MFARFNGPARRAILLAFREARRGQHEFLGTEHVLFGLLWDPAGPAVRLLRALGLSPDTLLTRVEGEIQEIEPGPAFERFPLSPAVRRAFDFAEDEAADRGHRLVGPEHLLAGLLREEGCEAAVTLARAGVRLADLRQALDRQAPAESPELLLQPGTSRGPAADDATPEELQQLVAANAGVRLNEKGQAVLDTGEVEREEGVASLHSPDQQIADINRQLYLTQLVYGGTLGGLLGYQLGGGEFGVLLGLGGIGIATLRSSLLGAWMGFIGGIMVPLFSRFDDAWTGHRILFGVAGAFLGSFLGNFWRRTPPRPPRVQ